MVLKACLADVPYSDPLCTSVLIVFFPSVPDGPPLNIQFSVQGPDSVMFSWEPPLAELSNGIITGYRISCVVDGDQTSDLIVASFGELSRVETVTGLTPATQYNCSLAARTAAGLGVNDTRVILTSKCTVQCK